MSNNLPHNDEDVLDWLREEYDHPFEGWDFSHLEGRRVFLDQPAWDYAEPVLPYLARANSVLDIDTGGGEVFSSLLNRAQFKGTACAVEPYPSNVTVARATLAPLSIDVIDNSADAADLGDRKFVLMISRHGGSLSPSEIVEHLEPGGWFISEQIGERTNQELRDIFGSASTSDDHWPHNAEDARQVFADEGLLIKDLQEQHIATRYMDVGALVYYLEAVPWEVPDFSIDAYAEVLLPLHRQAQERGYALDTTFHVYLIIARAP
jgi:hypothetical protein